MKTVYLIWKKKRLKNSENALKFDTYEMINLDILLFKKHNNISRPIFYKIIIIGFIEIHIGLIVSCN